MRIDGSKESGEDCKEIWKGERHGRERRRVANMSDQEVLKGRERQMGES